MKKKPGEVLKLAVKRMFAWWCLGKKQLTKLKIYSGSEHPHSSQNPKIIDVKKLNNKNIVEINYGKYSIKLKKTKIKLDFKDSKYATGRRKTSIAKVWVKKDQKNLR